MTATTPKEKAELCKDRKDTARRIETAKAEIKDLQKSIRQAGDAIYLKQRYIASQERRLARIAAELEPEGGWGNG